MKDVMGIIISIVVLALIVLAFPPLGLLLLAAFIFCFIFWGGAMAALIGGASIALRHESRKVKNVTSTKDAS